MSFIYLVALSGVAVVMLAIVLDAVRTVSRKPSWVRLARPMLVVVETEERRRHALPYVGPDRRQPAPHKEQAAREVA